MWLNPVACVKHQRSHGELWCTAPIPQPKTDRIKPILHREFASAHHSQASWCKGGTALQGTTKKTANSGLPSWLQQYNLTEGKLIGLSANMLQQAAPDE